MTVLSRLAGAYITSVRVAGDRLFVTSAVVGSDGEGEVGALFEVETGMTGRPPRNGVCGVTIIG